jgi:hypothetical protein
LQRREDVEMANGQMMGQGLYTTMSREMAETYGQNIHTIRNTRTGQDVEAFDADQVITNGDAEEFFAWVEGQSDADVWDVAEAFKLTQRERKSQGDSLGAYFTTKMPKSHDEISWANFFEQSRNAEVRYWITRFLEEKRNAGAIKHRGGTTHGTQHDVYVWLHPEDLEVRLDEQTGTGRYENKVKPLLSWMAGSDHWQYMGQTPVPESRIVRFGKRNPMVRNLHQTHAERVAMEKDDYSHLGDPKHDELLAREIALMQSLPTCATARTTPTSRAPSRTCGGRTGTRSRTRIASTGCSTRLTPPTVTSTGRLRPTAISAVPRLTRR